MINRPHGLTHETPGRTTINIYPTPTVYVDNADDHDNQKCEDVWEWAVKWTERAKMRFPLCNFSVTTGIHDADYRVYAEIAITGLGGSHSEAAEWLKWETE